MFFPFAQMIAYARVNGERRDDVGDFAASMVKDSHWPLFCDDRERLRTYTSSPTGAKRIAASSNSGGASSELPTQTAPSLRAKS